MESKKQVAHGWVDTIHVKFQEFAQQFDLSWQKITEYGIALGIGVFAGFLFKRYGKQAVVSVLVMFGVLLGLNYVEFISIDWLKIKGSLGLAPAETIQAFFQDFWQWAHAHFVTVLLNIVGFLIGFKIG